MRYLTTWIILRLYVNLICTGAGKKVKSWLSGSHGWENDDKYIFSQKFLCHCIGRKVHWTRQVLAETHLAKWTSIFWFNFVISRSNSKFTQIKESFSKKKHVCILFDFPEVRKDRRLLPVLLTEQLKGICLFSEEHLWAELSVKSIKKLRIKYLGTVTDVEIFYQVDFRIRTQWFLVIKQMSLLLSPHTEKEPKSFFFIVSMC